jgi:hypothetical protein
MLSRLEARGALRHGRYLRTHIAVPATSLGRESQREPDKDETHTSSALEVCLKIAVTTPTLGRAIPV